MTDDVSGGSGVRADARILVVENEAEIAALVAYHLSREGYRVETAASGGDAAEALEREAPDLVILDRMLPDFPGDEILRFLRRERRTRTVPVLVLSALREEEERVEGLELGADDYLSKPFSPRELVLRIRALLRRAQAARKEEEAMLRAEGLTLDRDAHQAFLEGQPLELTALEFRLLRVFLERKGQTQSRRQLLERVWDLDPGLAGRIRTRTVDMHVRRLRRQLGAHGQRIQTVRGFGYRFH